MKLRCLVIALALSAAYATDSLGQSPSETEVGKQEQAKPANNNQPAAAEQKSSPQQSIIVHVEPAKKTEAEADEDRRERKEKADLDRRLVDLTAELSTYTGGLYFATVILAIATIVLCISTIGLVVMAVVQSRDMKHSLLLTKIAADAAKKSADASLVALRPWISCKVEIAGALTYTDTGDAQFELRFVVKNVGRSPAFGVRLIPSLNLLSPVHERSILRLQRIADHNRSIAVEASVVLIPGGIRIGGAELGLILFPDETSTFVNKIPISRGEIERSFEDIKPNEHFFPEVFGLVTYAYPLADVRADTGFVCGIENVTPDSKSGFAFELGQSVRPEYMRVANHWGGFAT
jgi:hypothetical protein